MGVSHSCTKQQSVAVTDNEDVDNAITSSSQKRIYKFHSFPELSDDLMIEILSYVTFGPFEEGLETRGGKKASLSDASSSLTHNLPLVSSHFRDLCKLDLFWLPSLQRLVYSDREVFKEVLKVMLNAEFKKPPWSAFHDSDVDKDSFLLAAKVKKMDTLNKEDMFELVSNVYKNVYKSIRNQSIEIMNEMDNADEDGKARFSSARSGLVKRPCIISPAPSSCIRNIDSARSMYLSLIKVYANPIYPVFHMRSRTVSLGILQSLLFFEPRYRMLISEVMKGRKKKYHQGHPLSAPRPRFIFAHTGQVLRPGLSAFVVEVCRCRMLDGGRAHILIKPVERVKLISVSEREVISNGLHDARIMRLS
eukprot:CAMPEP_0204644962 /NCGR_PEP_ID=MMETSP0718-20130828/1847_1 /ASSEMBLY_ACC=CAM_ASM_000674 /TAXON_ID=230516 /ORGANISM="Chaetoceros curvisetus" /LENGTH=362 /DNA_ID=CAMNT_0051666675 /DNA_START=87 /DNA_END=1175 /DNA_ORIENTATION=+